METSKSDVEKVSSVGKANGDFLVYLYHRGFHHVVEKIILEFPWRTALVCRAVSKDWLRIVEHFQESQIPRHLRMQEARKAAEWKDKNCVIKSSNFGTIMPDHIFHSYNIIGDSKNVVIHAVDTPYDLRVIIVFDAQTLRMLKIISPYNPPLVGQHSRVLISMDEEYLYTYVESGEIECSLWKRSKKFSYVSTKKVIRTFNLHGMGSFEISDIPCAHKGLLYLPVYSSRPDRKLVLNVWDVDKNTKTVVGKDFPSEDFFLLRNGSGDFFTSQGNILHFYSKEVFISLHFVTNSSTYVQFVKLFEVDFSNLCKTG